MASDGVFLPAASACIQRYRTPHIAIVALTVWSALLALSGTYEQLFTYVMFASILFSVATGLALFRLQAHDAGSAAAVPDVGVSGRSRRVHARARARSSLNTLLERPVESLAGLGLLALGLPAYWYWGRRGSELPLANAPADKPADSGRSAAKGEKDRV